jgi:hypothetical protein
MRDFRGLSCILLISLILLPGLAAANGPGGGAHEPSSHGPDWAQGAGISAHFARREHFTSVHVASTDELIAAINSANSSDRPTVIHVAAGTYVFDQTFDSNFGASVLPPITATVMVVGSRSTATILDGRQGMPHARAFTVLTGGRLLLRQLTLQNFSMQCPNEADDCRIIGGGALENVGGDLRVEGCILSANNVFNENGDATYGGGILSQSGRLELEDTTVTQSRSISQGAGVAVTGGSAVIRHSTLSQNNVNAGAGSGFSGEALGAGLLVQGAKVWVANSTLTQNLASDCDCEDTVFASGAGIYNGGETWVTDSAITQNVGNEPGQGGGIYNTSRMIVVNTTIAGNSAGSAGGGVFNVAQLTLVGTTITGNSMRSEGFSGGAIQCGLYIPNGEIPPPACDIGGGGVGTDAAATTRIMDSVVAGNPTGNCYGTLVSEGHNAIGSDSSCTLQLAQGAGHDQPSVNPLFGVLSDDGEPGDAHYPLLSNSPLIDAGGQPGRNCTLRDQIGNPRINGRHPHHGQPLCDIGAIEFQ